MNVFSLIVPGFIAKGAYDGAKKGGALGALKGGAKELFSQGVAYSIIPAALVAGAGLLGGGAIVMTAATVGGFLIPQKVVSLFSSEEEQVAQADGTQTESPSLQAQEQHVDALA